MNKVEYTHVNTDGATVTSTLNNVSESAEDSAVAAFVTAFTSLSKNTVTGAEISEQDTLNIPSGDPFYLSENEFAVFGSGVTLNNRTKTTGEKVGIYGNNNKVSLGSGADTVTNTGAGVSINAGYGDNSINNTGDNVSINASVDNDSIYNTGERVTIKAGAGNDTIFNTGAGVTISAGAGDNSINNTGDNVSISASVGDDSISNSGAGVSIYAGAGKDSIYSTGAGVSIEAGAGKDTINIQGHPTAISIDCLSGNTTISGFDPAQDWFYINSSYEQTVSGSLNSDNNAVISISYGSTSSYNILVGSSGGTFKYKTYANRNTDNFDTITIP